MTALFHDIRYALLQLLATTLLADTFPRVTRPTPCSPTVSKKRTV